MQEQYQRHKRFRKDLVDDMKRLEGKETDILPTILHDGAFLSLEQWQAKLANGMTRVVEDIKGDDELAPHVIKITDIFDKQEYAMIHLSLNINVYKDQEYVDHLGALNLFISKDN